MTTSPLPSATRRVLPAIACLALASAYAQQAPVPAPSAAALAKYDVNKNGLLEPAEVAAMQADQQRAANAAVANGDAPKTEDVISLSPFEVVSDTKGYYASNTMSGTRFNSKLEDLAASVTVMTKEQM